MKREDELHLQVQAWSVTLTEKLDDIGFTDFVLSMYAGHDAVILPRLATTALSSVVRPMERYLKRRRQWITHLSIVREAGVLRYSFEIADSRPKVIYRDADIWRVRADAAR